MKLITKSSAPTSFQQYKLKEHTSYKTMDSDVKKDLQQALLDEQKGICAYCQQKIAIDTMTIEHHCEHSICDGSNGTTDRRLDYSNLFAVCFGQGGGHNSSIKHCDTQKSKFDANNGLPMELLPTNRAHMQTISYSTNGKIKSSNTKYDNELNRFLNLNVFFLKDIRKQLWSTVFRLCYNPKTKQLNKKKMQRLLETKLTLTNNHYANHFPGMYEYMMTKYCS